MANVPLYRNAEMNIFGMVKPLMERCEKFLRKYGRLDWCVEIDTVVTLFGRSYEIRLKSALDRPLAREYYMMNSLFR